MVVVSSIVAIMCSDRPPAAALQRLVKSHQGSAEALWSLGVRYRGVQWEGGAVDESVRDFGQPLVNIIFLRGDISFE